MKLAPARLEKAHDARVARVLAHGAAVIVEAPGGFGKTHLLSGLRAARPDAQLLATADELTRAAELGPRSSLVLIDVVEPDAAALADLAAAESVRTLVVVGRVIGTDVRSVLAPYPCLELGVDDLRLTSAETHELLRRDGGAAEHGLVDLIHAQTNGWPAAVCSVRPAAATQTLRDLAANGIACDPVVHDYLAGLVAGWPGEVTDAVRRFGTLESITVAAFDAATRPGLAADGVRAGVPLCVRADGWVELPALLRDHLGAPSDRDAATIAPHLARSGGLLPAVRALVSSGCSEAAGALLCDAPPELLDGTDGAEVLGLLDVIERTFDNHRLSMLRVRAHELLSDVVGAEQVAARVARDADPVTPEYVDAQLELTRTAAMRGEVTDVEPWRERATTAEQSVRLDEILAIQQSQDTAPDVVAQGARGLARVAAGWEALGYAARASRSLRVMAAMPLTHLGEYGRAIDAVMRARQLSWNRLFDRAACTAFLARAAGLAGRVELLDREVNAATQLVDAVPVPWLRLYVNWARTLRAAWCGDAAGVVEAALATERTLDGLESHSTATVLFAELAVAHAMVGRHDSAATYLARASDRRRDNRLEVDLAAAIVAARAGQEGAPQMLELLRADPTVPRSRLWRVELEIAVAEGDGAAAGSAASAATLTGSSEVAELVQRVPRSAPHELRRVRVGTMGDVSVHVGDQRVAVPSGRPGQLLQLLAVQPGPVSTDLLVDALWPEADFATGLRRLKNPINRLRASLGADSVVRRGSSVGLGPDVIVDLRAFEAHASVALARHDTPQGVTEAVSALDLYAPVLPGTRLAEVAAAATAAQSRAASLLDLVVGAEPSARPPSPWLLSTALRVDRFDDTRLLAIAAVAIGEGNPSCARQCLTEVRRVAETLDVPLPAAVLRLEAELAPAAAS